MTTAKPLVLPGVVLLAGAMFAAPASASDSKGGFALHGIGAQTCGVMLQELHPAAPPPATPPAATATPAPAAPASASAGAPAPGTPAATAAPAAAAPAAAAPPTSVAAATPPVANQAPPAPTMRPILTSWILGYLTASDRLEKDTFDETPVMAPEALNAMIIGVCQKYPDARVETVANTVFSQLAAARVMHESPIVEARSGSQFVPIRKATLIAVQATLVKNKLMKDPADGNFGSATEAALKAFQKSQGLPETGLPDPATVVRLLVEMPARAASK
jgi:peptidoglycan hydrolase-like protein with peptidoglycan-binding domain